MPITNQETGTRIDEIEDGIFRVSTPVPPSPSLPPGFTFNQFLIRDEESLLFHTGPRRMFPLVREAVATVLRPETLRYVAFSHAEQDESGALAEWLALSPSAVPVTGRIGAMIFVPDATDRPARALADGESLALGKRRISWFDAPHVPHGWDCGFIGETVTKTLFCGDLFTQGGAAHDPVTETDIVGPSEAMRGALDYFAHGPNTAAVVERLARFEPRLLACMHGTSYRGDGAAQLRALASSLAGNAPAR